MLQKAIIEQKIDKYSMKVRIPVYNKIKSDPTATPTEELYTAIIQTLPGCSPVYQEGDLVLVAFENENLAYPVIIGLLYRENMSQGSTDVIADSLKVNVNSDLTENTFIGYVTPDAIKKLNDKYQNNVKKVVVEYSLSNYEDHYDQFSQWSEQAPQFWPGKFMWQRTTVTYENDLITRSMTCIQGAKGDPGSSITIVDNYVKYAINNSGTEHPNTSAQNVWYENPPQTTDVNPYLWSWTYVLFSDGTSNDTFSVARTSANSIIVYLYKRSDTEISQIDWSDTLTYNFDTKRFSTLPTGWSSDIPSGNDPIYVTAATVSSVNTQGYVPAASWSTPMLFTKSGFNSKTIQLYKRSATAPSAPSTTVTYTFSTGAISPTSPNGWSLGVPTSNGNPCYVVQATAISYEDTDTITSGEWSSPTVIAQDGSSDYIDQPIVDWYIATSNTNVPTTPTSDIEVASEWTTLGWTNDISSITLSETNKYLWNAEVAHYSISGYVKTNAHIITVYAESGNGILSSTIYYYVDTQGATPPADSASWSTTFPSSIQQGQYLWTKTVTEYTDTSMPDSVVYSVSRDGETGSDGKGITSIVEYYAINNSDTTPPTAGSSDWHTTPMNPTSSNRYLWSYQVISYTTGSPTTTTPHVISMYAEDGAAGSNAATVFLYQRAESASSLTKPSSTLTYTFSTGVLSGTLGNWTQTIPATNGNPCFVIQATAIGTGTTDTIASSEWSNIVKLIEDGQDGSDGKNTAVVYLYKRAASASIDWTSDLTYSFTTNSLTSTPSGWSSSVPLGTDPLYMTAATASSTTSSDIIPYTEWATPIVLAQNGTDGGDGSSSATVFLYQRAASASSITKPSSTLTYTFATGTLSGTLGNWTQTIPASDGNPCFVIQATAVSASATDTIASSEWSNIVELVSDGQDGSPGTNGLNNAIVYLYKRSSSAATIDWTNTLTYNFENKALTSTPTGWSETIPSGTNPIYVTAASASSNTSTDTIAYTEWATPVILAQNGANGTNGRSITGVVNYYLATDQDSGVTRSTSGWTTTIQNVTSTNKYLWNYEEITYSSGSPTYTDPCIIGAYGDNGATGVGISSITEYYALSTTTTRPSSGWSTTLPEMDATNRYLWNYSVITYTNGSSSGTSSDALIIGVYGDSVISLEIQSDNGTLFNSKTLSSTLSAVVYLGAAQLTVASNGTVSNGGTTVGQLNWFAKERFVGNGTAVTFDTGLDILNYNNNPTIEITIDGTVTTAYSVSDQNTIVFTTAPTDGSVIIISYLTSTSGSLLVQRTDVRNQIVVTCKLVSGVNTIATAEVTIKDLNDATSLQSWYMLTVPDAQFISLPTVVYDSSNYTVVPTGSYSYQLLDPNTQQYVEYTATFTWENVAPSVDIQTGSNVTCVCYSFQMIIFYDNSCSAGTVERNATFDSAVSAYYQAQDASNAANQAQSTANEAADGVQSNSDKITGIQSTLTAIDGVLASKLDTVVFQPYQENIDSFIQFDVPNSTMTLGKGNFKQQLSSTKNSFMEGPTEIAYISNQELYINNTTINQKLAFDEQWIVTFDNTNGLIIKHV